MRKHVSSITAMGRWGLYNVTLLSMKRHDDGNATLYKRHMPNGTVVLPFQMDLESRFRKSENIVLESNGNTSFYYRSVVWPPFTFPYII